MSVIFITGGNGGLGKAIASGLQDDNQVIIGGLHEQELAQAASEIGCDYLVCDVTDWGSIDFVVGAIIEKYGRLDVLINSAGLYTVGKIEDIDPYETKRVFDVNTVGPLLMAKAVVPHMKQQNNGHIININSIGGVTVKTERTVYYGSKWGLTGISKHLKNELEKYNIKVTDLRPAALEKTMLQNGESSPREAYLPYAEMVDTIKFILSRNNNINISELGIQENNFE